MEFTFNVEIHMNSTQNALFIRLVNLYHRRLGLGIGLFMMIYVHIYISKVVLFLSSSALLRELGSLCWDPVLTGAVPVVSQVDTKLTNSLSHYCHYLSSLFFNCIQKAVTSSRFSWDIGLTKNPDLYYYERMLKRQ